MTNQPPVYNAPSSAPRPQATRPEPPRYLDVPMAIDNRGRTARSNDDEHIRDMIRAVLFTEPGERVNRPDFGCALKTLVFLPNHEALAAATRTLIHGSLLQWLSREIIVEAVDVEAVEAELRISIVYQRRDDGSRHSDVITQSTRSAS